ncbi:Zn2+ transporter [Handroanthus impetiginosus]|uniref:Zn2+ transporter n=1 Tax=Handroanthus impetiginosus TaxID=429701 RepID=A0A2G9I360_9LAMI|nr:Zn2+ transporter [Handroanthus impetiginosus]
MDTQNSEHGHVIQVCGDVPTVGRRSVGSKACAGVVCSFFDAKISSQDVQERSASIREILIAISLCIIFMSIEATSRQSYGFLRTQILGALASILMIRLTAECWDPFKGFLMFLNTAIGLLDIIMTIVLGHNHGHSNSHDHGQGHGHGDDGHEDHGHGSDDNYMRSHGAVVTKHSKNKKKRLNINVQGAIFLIVVPNTIRMLRNILEVLMESTPKDIDVMKLEKGISKVKEVVAVHELHIWAITAGKILLAARSK